MTDPTLPQTPEPNVDPVDYHPPEITYLGDLADLTQVKMVGSADGTTFNTVDLGS